LELRTRSSTVGAGPKPPLGAVIELLDAVIELLGAVIELTYDSLDKPLGQLDKPLGAVIELMFDSLADIKPIFKSLSSPVICDPLMVSSCIVLLHAES
jgi:hypothetical protein